MTTEDSYSYTHVPNYLSPTPTITLSPSVNCLSLSTVIWHSNIKWT